MSQLLCYFCSSQTANMLKYVGNPITHPNVHHTMMLVFRKLVSHVGEPLVFQRVIFGGLDFDSQLQPIPLCICRLVGDPSFLHFCIVFIRNLHWNLHCTFCHPSFVAVAYSLKHFVSGPEPFILSTDPTRIATDPDCKFLLASFDFYLQWLLIKYVRHRFAQKSVTNHWPQRQS